MFPLLNNIDSSDAIRVSRLSDERDGARGIRGALVG